MVSLGKMIILASSNKSTSFLVASTSQAFSVVASSVKVHHNLSPSLDICQLTRLRKPVLEKTSLCFIQKKNYAADAMPKVKVFAEHEVVPDVIDTAPSAGLKVHYDSGAEVNFGNELTPTQVKHAPKVEWEADPNTLYTLCMTDPDAPSRQQHTYREWHHWLVVNIPGSDISKGEVLSEYVGSGPPKGTGHHRYVLLVFKQKGKIDADEPRLTNRSGDHRGKFSISKFAKKYHLGHAIAGNFYQAQWDDWVPELYKQLEG